MSWIESHQSLLQHRKLVKAARLLKCDKYKLIGHLHALWWWGLDNANDDGLLEAVELTDLAVAAEWNGRADAEQFGLVLIESGFVDADADQRRFWLHDWWDYAGKLNTQRELRRESNRAAQKRYRQRLTPADSKRLVSAPSALTGDDSKHPTVPNQPNQPRESTDQGKDARDTTRGALSGDALRRNYEELFSEPDEGGDVSGQASRRASGPFRERSEGERAYLRIEAKYREACGRLGDRSAAGRAWLDAVPPGDEAAVEAALAGYLASAECKQRKADGLEPMALAKWLGQWRDWTPKAPVAAKPVEIRGPKGELLEVRS